MYGKIVTFEMEKEGEMILTTNLHELERIFKYWHS